MSVFRVNLNGTDQAGIPNNEYTIVAWSGVAENEDGLWTTNGCVPPAGDVHFDWQVWVSAGFGGSNPSIVAKLIKNYTLSGDQLVSGTDVVAAIGAPGGIAGTAACAAGVDDVANGTDYYNLFLYVTASDPGVGCTIDGNPAHTYLSGATP